MPSGRHNVISTGSPITYLPVIDPVDIESLEELLDNLEFI